jgi:hypothetical protein
MSAELFLAVGQSQPSAFVSAITNASIGMVMCVKTIHSSRISRKSVPCQDVGGKVGELDIVNPTEKDLKNAAA